MDTTPLHWSETAAYAPLPPLAPGLPILGSALEMGGDMLAFLVRMYRQHGPIFRIRALSRELYILCGLEGNQFMARAGDGYLSGAQVFGGFNEEMHSTIVPPALDGEKHNYYRKLLRPAFSRERLTPHYPRLIDIAREHVRGWHVGQRLRVVPAMQRVITDLLGTALVGMVTGEYFQDLREMLNTLISVKVMKTLPEWAFRLPSYQRRKRRAHQFMGEILAANRERLARGETTDNLVETVLNALTYEGQAFSEDDLRATGFGAFFVGMDTAAHTSSFTLYALLKHPEALLRVQTEIDAVFSQPTVTPNDLRGMRLLHNAIVESTRLFPVAPIMPRNATRDFAFCGYRVPKGADVMMVTGLTHYLDEYFPNARTFDLDRPQPEQPYIYAPFGLGAHTCMGAGLAEVLLALALGGILHTARLALDPPDWTAQVVSVPVPNPGMKFHVKVLEKR
jgi:cytochrome P450